MMNSFTEDDLKGIRVRSTDTGFIIELDGLLYRRINENINSGKSTKAFYHELKSFIKNIKTLE